MHIALVELLESAAAVTVPNIIMADAAKRSEDLANFMAICPSAGDAVALQYLEATDWKLEVGGDVVSDFDCA